MPVQRERLDLGSRQRLHGGGLLELFSYRPVFGDGCRAAGGNDFRSWEFSP
jgi:hypothetical protein